MCYAIWLWRCHPRYRFFLALNRDEYFDRPTFPTHWWKDQEGLFGGRDAVNGGTWLGCTKCGRLAFLTNFREPNDQPSLEVVSRGHLVTRFLQSSKSPKEYAEEVLAEVEEYNGFNLVVANLCSGEMAYVSNRPKDAPVSILEVPPGLHVLTNGSLDSPWPKSLRGRGKMETLLDEAGGNEIPEDRIVEELLMDDSKANRIDLPNTGCSEDCEYMLSSIFVKCQMAKGQFGTRSMAVVAVQNDGHVNFYERFMEDGIWNEQRNMFVISSNELPRA